MSTHVPVLQVAIDARTGGAEATYTYRDPGGYVVGQAALVPLGTRQVVGFVVEQLSRPAEDLEFPVTSLRSPVAAIADVVLPDPVMKMVDFITKEYLCSTSAALIAAVPPGLKDRLVTTWELGDLNQNTAKLTPSQSETLRVMVAQGGKILDRKSAPLTSPVKKTLRNLRDLGMVRETLSLVLAAEKHRLSQKLQLTPDTGKIEAFLAGSGKRRPAQVHLLMTMQGAESTTFEAHEIKTMSGATDQTIKGLMTAGLLVEVEELEPIPPPPPTPNPQQAIAIEEIIGAVREHRPDTYLLYGVTGSGKTEVFLRTASEAIRTGRQVLYLVPEISLTPQVIGKLRERFGKSVAVMHSNMTPTERLQSWFRARSGEAAVVLGARSALFAPLENVGLIILDEEHEPSYKQESAPRYNTRTVAQFLGRVHQCPVVLGSATPSLESAYAAEVGDYKLLTLPYRTAEAQLPHVQIVDLTLMYAEKKAAVFSDELQEELIATMTRGDQAILFLNRRAYAPFLQCRHCGHTFQCVHCSVSLSYHQRANLLKCHHCDYREHVPESCPQCGGTKVGPFGIGTERVEEAVRELLGNARVARLDRDVVQRKGSLEEILANFRTGEIDVLVGTQMVAKGLDFPRVTLVGVIAADTSLNMPDFRASERTFQLLSQVAGRAGRGQHPGRVIIQTFSPNHPAIQRAADHDFHGLYKQLIAERDDANYPPFCDLVNITFTSSDLSEANLLASRVVTQLQTYVDGIEVKGPVECALAKLRDVHRVHALVKMPREMPKWFITDALSGIDVPSGASITIDVDPYSMI
ncbi:MAG: primosomal protein N' [Chthonomonas sp.]|nr:primosomal protein N' [Chthonomonas sp.]